MNSRLAAACRRHPVITSFEGTLQLYLTLDAPSAEPHASRGRLRAGLVQETVHRLRALIANPGDRPFPVTVDATRYRWVDGDQSNWLAPGPVPQRPDADRHVSIFRMALRTLTLGRALPAEVRDLLQANVSRRPAEELAVIEGAMDTIQRWRPGGGVVRRTSTATSSRQVIHPGTPPPTATQDTSGEPPAEDSESLYEPPDSLYEPPGSDPSAGYVSLGCSDDPDLQSETESPSVTVISYQHDSNSD